ncbi:MAG: TRAP transporter small permease subunit [Rhodospirillales bacterium]|nr:TRAP transporter small permease subunit [Rhodospirillales bacterium]
MTDNQTLRSFNRIAQMVRALTWLHLAVAGSLFFLSTCALAADVVLRYFFSAPIAGLHESMTLAFTFVFMLGAAALYARNQDIVLDFVYLRLPVQVQRYLVLGVYLAIVVALIVVLYHTIHLINLQWNLPTPALRIPQSVFVVPVAIAMASIIVTSLVESWACVIWICSGIRPSVWP